MHFHWLIKLSWQISMLPVKRTPGDIHSKDIQKLLLEKGKEAYYFPSFEEIEKFLREKCINGDLLITMGAGDVVLVGEALIK